MEAAKVSIVGTGNIAWHLVQMFSKARIHIQSIYGRDFQKASALAKCCNADPRQLNSENIEVTDTVLFFAVADDAIRNVAATFNYSEIISVHVSGAVESDVLYFNNNRYGVYYPLQSFSKEVETDYRIIPVCIVTLNIEVENLLSGLAKTISTSVYKISDEQKSKLHLAAVIVNNFTNYLYSNAFEILDETGISKDILFPLMQETIDKIKRSTPDEMQTGPARRGDAHTLQKHRELLKSNPELMELYDVLSKSIQKKFLGN